MRSPYLVDSIRKSTVIRKKSTYYYLLTNAQILKTESKSLLCRKSWITNSCHQFLMRFDEECARNSRARSAKLRIFQKGMMPPPLRGRKEH